MPAYSCSASSTFCSPAHRRACFSLLHAGRHTLECSAMSSGYLLLATMPGALLFERCSSIPPTELTPVCSSKAAARVLPLRLLPQLVRIPRPCIAFHFVPNASPTPSKHCERPSARSAPSACVYASAVESGMEWQGSTATSMIDVVRVILHVASAVLLPSDVLVVCAAGCLAGVRTFLRCPCQCHIMSVRWRVQLRTSSVVYRFSFCSHVCGEVHAYYPPVRSYGCVAGNAGALSVFAERVH